MNSKKLCGFCHCGDNTSLGLGELHLFESTIDVNTQKTVLFNIKDQLRHLSNNKANGDEDVALYHLQKSFENKLNRFLAPNDDKIDPLICLKELLHVGWPNIDDKTLVDSVFEDTGQLWAHKACALWSDTVTRDIDSNTLTNVDKAMFKGFKQKCSLCDNYGATMQCTVMNCNKKFHFPCATSSGCYLDIKSFRLLCHDHLEQAIFLFDRDASCAICCLNERLFEQLYCTSCGTHYHGSCLSINIETNPVGRAGWQCPECKICQTCRQPGDDSKMLVCDTCDKCYHTFCLKPQMTTIPKNGWKCTSCRMCTDCHTLVAFKWHSNYSLCDFCHQKSKGLGCNVCKKQFKANANPKQIRMCLNCNKYVHGECDKGCALNDDRYACPQCRERAEPQQYADSFTKIPLDRQSSKTSYDDYIYSPAFDFNNQDSKSSLNDDNSSNMDSDFAVNFQNTDSMTSTNNENSNQSLKPVVVSCAKTGLGRGKPGFVYNAPNNGKKKQLSRKSNRNQKRQNYSNTDKGVTQTRGRSSRSSKRLDSRYSNNSDGQSNCSNDINLITNQNETEQVDEPTIGHIKRDEDESHAVTVLVSLEDSFTLNQDMCLSCGSFGVNEEGRIIACSQCGQCYHTYCAGITKISRVILEKGWRCLDCTVCEGCGKASDEGRLLLCDDCDISYHIYCLDPPLEHVPEGNWKCKWCIKCNKCGSKTPGNPNCEWKTNYTECELCYSLSTCPLCNKAYKDSEIILKCIQCDRWCHTTCDPSASINEDEADRLANDGFFCNDCKPKPYSKMSNQHVPENASHYSPASCDTVASPQPQLPIPKRGILEEGVYLTDVGVALIKKIRVKPPAPVRRQRAPKSNMAHDQKNSQSKADKNDDDLSNGSSCDEKNDEPMDVNQMISPTRLDSVHANDKESPNSDLNANQVTNNSKRGKNSKKTLKVGIGGFSVKVRSRSKQNHMFDANGSSMPDNGDMSNGLVGDTMYEKENDAKKKTCKRRKKPTIEDTFPEYMQAAFFGTDTLDKTKKATSTDIKTMTAANKLDEEKIQMLQSLKKDENYSIHLDDNIVKLAQQKRKNEMDLGFEDLLDGDIVNYIFNENRNFIEPNGRNDLIASSRLKDSNDEKIFDDGLYEDLLNQIGLSGGSNDPNEPELLQSMTPPGDSSALFNTSAFSNSEINMDLNKSNNSSMNNQGLMHGLGAVDQQPQHDHQLSAKQLHNNNNMTANMSHHHLSNTIGDTHIQQKDTKQIDDLVREFREYSNEFTIGSQQRMQPPMKPQQQQHVIQQQQPQHQQQVNYGMGANQTFSLNQAQMQQTSNSASMAYAQMRNPLNKPTTNISVSVHASDMMLKQHQQQQQQAPNDPLLFNQANQTTMYALNNAQQSLIQRQNQLRIQQQQQQQQLNMMSQQQQQQSYDGYMNLNMPSHAIDIPYQASIQQQQQQQQQQQHMHHMHDIPGAKMNSYHMADSLISDQAQHIGTDGIDVTNNKPMYANAPLDNQQQQDKSWLAASAIQQDPRFFNNNQLNKPATSQPVIVNIGLAGQSVQQSLSTSGTDDPKHAKLIEKFQMDEDMGEYATQAMVLYSNLNYPSLKQEYPDRNERFKQVQKLWRKLDAAAKQNFVNKARQNRSKKRCDDKQPTRANNKQLKSPSCNSDKMSFSDVENLSRAETPSIAGGLDSNIDESLSSGLNVTATNQTNFIRLKSIDTVVTGQNESTHLQQIQQIDNNIVHQQQQQAHEQQGLLHLKHSSNTTRMPQQQQQQVNHMATQPLINVQQFRFQSPVKHQTQQMSPSNQLIQSNNIMRHPQQQQQQQLLLYQLQHQQNPNDTQQIQQRTTKSIDMDSTDLFSIVQARQNEYIPMGVQQHPATDQHSPSNPSYVYDPFAMPTQRQVVQQQTSEQNSSREPHESPYQTASVAPKTPSHVNTPIGSPHTDLASLQQYSKKASPFSRPPSTPHSEHSTSQQQLIDNSPYNLGNQRNVVLDVGAYDQIQQQQKQSQMSLLTSPRMQRPLTTLPATQQQQTLTQSPQNNFNQLAFNYAQQNATPVLIQQSPQQQQQQQVLFQTQSPLQGQYQQGQQQQMIATILSPQQQQHQSQSVSQLNSSAQRMYIQQSPTTTTTTATPSQLPQSPVNQQVAMRQLFTSNSPVNFNFNENQILIQQATTSPGPRNIMQRHATSAPTANSQRFSLMPTQAPGSNQPQQVMFNIDQTSFQLLSPQQQSQKHHLQQQQQQQQQHQTAQIVYQNHQFTQQQQQQQQQHAKSQTVNMFNMQQLQQRQQPPQPLHKPSGQPKSDPNQNETCNESTKQFDTAGRCQDDEQQQITHNSPSQASNLFDHVDQLIADVAAGAGIIPYTTSDDLQNESTEDSQMSCSTDMASSTLNSNCATEISETTLQRANIMLLQLPTDDFNPQQQQYQQQPQQHVYQDVGSINEFPPTKSQSDLKIYKILADAKHEEQLQQTSTSMSSSMRSQLKPQQKQQAQQQVFMHQHHQQQQQQSQPRHPIVVASIQQQQQQQAYQQHGNCPSNQVQQVIKTETTGISDVGGFPVIQQQQQWTPIKQSQTIAQIQASKYTTLGTSHNAQFTIEVQQQPTTTLDDMSKGVSDRLLAIEKEISSLRRKRTDLNKKNKLILSKIEQNPKQTDGSDMASSSLGMNADVANAVDQLNDQQRQKHAANQQDLDMINKTIVDLQKQCDEYKKEQKMLQQKIEQNQKHSEQHDCRLNENATTVSPKMLLVGGGGGGGQQQQQRLSKDNQKNYDLLYINQQQQQSSTAPINVLTIGSSRAAIYDPTATSTSDSSHYIQSANNGGQLIQINASSILGGCNQSATTTSGTQPAYIIMTQQQQQQQMSGNNTTTTHQQIIEQLSLPTNATSTSSKPAKKTSNPKTGGERTQTKKKSIKDISTEATAGIGRHQHQVESSIMSLDFKIDPKQMISSSSASPPQQQQQMRLIQKPIIVQQQQQPIFVQTKAVSGQQSNTFNLVQQQQQQSTGPMGQHQPISIQLFNRTMTTQFMQRPHNISNNNNESIVQQQQQQQDQIDGIGAICQDENLRKMLTTTDTQFDNDSASSLLIGTTTRTQTTGDEHMALSAYRGIINSNLASRLDDDNDGDASGENISETMRPQSLTTGDLLEHMQMDGTVDQFLTDTDENKATSEQQQTNPNANDGQQLRLATTTMHHVASMPTTGDHQQQHQPHHNSTTTLAYASCNNKMPINIRTHPNNNDNQIKLSSTTAVQQIYQQQQQSQPSVILNHELLANYGVSVQQQQQQQTQVNSLPLYTGQQHHHHQSPQKFIQIQATPTGSHATTNATFILNNSGNNATTGQQQQPANNNSAPNHELVNFQQYISLQQSYQYQQQPQQQQLISSYQTTTANSMDNNSTLGSQVDMAAITRHAKAAIKPTSDFKKHAGNSNQRHLDDGLGGGGGSTDQIGSVGMVSGHQMIVPPPPPSAPSALNTDNTLLKQLLQTAPRNANDQQKVTNHQFNIQQHNSPVQQQATTAIVQQQQQQLVYQLKTEPNLPQQQQPIISQTTETDFDCNGLQVQVVHRDYESNNNESKETIALQQVQNDQAIVQKVVKKRVRKAKPNDEPPQQQPDNNCDYDKMRITQMMEQQQTKSEPKKPRKRTTGSNAAHITTHTPSKDKKDALNEIELNDMLDKLKRLPPVELSQPLVDTFGNLPVNYPGKYKQKVSNASIQQAKCGKYGSFSIDSILNKNDAAKPVPKAHNADNNGQTMSTSTGSNKQQLEQVANNKENESTKLVRYFDKRFKVCNALIDNTNDMQTSLKSAASFANTIMDSSKRIKYLVDSDYPTKAPSSPSSETVMSTSSIDDEMANSDSDSLLQLKSLYDHQHLKLNGHTAFRWRATKSISEQQQEQQQHQLPTTSSSPSSTTTPPSPQAHHHHHETPSRSPIYDLIDSFHTAGIHSIKQEPLFNHTVDTNQAIDKVAVTLTLTKGQANDIRSVMAAIAELLPINLPASWDMGTVSQGQQLVVNQTAEQLTNNINTCLNNIKQQLQQQQLQASAMYKLNRETGYNIQAIINGGLVRTCKFCESILLDDHEFLARKQDDITRLVSYAQLVKAQAKVAPAVVDTCDSLYFCTDACLASYVRLLNLQYKQRLLMESFQAAVPGGGVNCQTMSADGQAGVSSTASCSSSYNELFATDDSDGDRQRTNRHKRKLTDSSSALLAATTRMPAEKRWKGLRWRKFDSALPLKTIKLPTNKDIDDLIERLDVNVALKNVADRRACCFCHVTGDQETKSAGRLLMLDVASWSHLNCALWSNEVYETMNGALINVDVAYKRSMTCECFACHHKGASLKCFSPKCSNYYHLTCAIKEKCVFYQDKTFYCSTHAQKSAEHNVVLTDLAVHRKVWIQRNEVGQIQNFMSSDQDDINYAIRVGSIVLYNIGQLLPHQIKSSKFHNRDFIYPVGYKATRFYWSLRRPNKRCRYQMTINEHDGSPIFTIVILDDGCEPDILTDNSPSELWTKILSKIVKLRQDYELVNLFPMYFSGEFLFGLTEPHIMRLIESLPGAEMLNNYAFKYGKMQLLDMPLTINPSGCARSEPKLRTHFRPFHTLTCSTTSSTSSATHPRNSSLPRALDTAENPQIPYVKQFVLSKSTQYKKLKAEWRNIVYLAKSRIQGLGLYAARDMEKHTMVIEYIGELIRNEVANRREQLYQQQNRGVYMFRLDDDHVIDATICGGLARYVNHCCNPNCIAEIVNLEKERKIIIISNRRIAKGEELTYDYKFEFEDESNKLPCLCGAPNCKKWMN